jgi:hypothetical protein
VRRLYPIADYCLEHGFDAYFAVQDLYTRTMRGTEAEGIHPGLPAKRSIGEPQVAFEKSSECPASCDRALILAFDP